MPGTWLSVPKCIEINIPAGSTKHAVVCLLAEGDWYKRFEIHRMNGGTTLTEKIATNEDPARAPAVYTLKPGYTYRIIPFFAKGDIKTVIPTHESNVPPVEYPAGDPIISYWEWDFGALEVIPINQRAGIAIMLVDNKINPDLITFAY